MADIDLTQSEADGLIAMEKERVNDDLLYFPEPGARLNVPLRSLDRRESFLLDVTRSRISLTKATFQARARQVIVLLRLDMNGGPHRNPDGAEIECPHLHIYREGFGDKWAFELPSDLTSGDQNLYAFLTRFMTYCRIVVPPDIEEGLF